MKTFCVWPEFTEAAVEWCVSLAVGCCWGTTFAIGTVADALLVDMTLTLPRIICETDDDGIVVTEPVNVFDPRDVIVRGTTVADAGTF